MRERGDYDASLLGMSTCGSVLGAIATKIGFKNGITARHIENHRALASWLLDWLAGASEEEKDILLHAAYGLWLARNDARDGKRIAQPHEK